MNQREIEQYLIDFQKREEVPLIERSLKVPLSQKKINVLIGPRRAGKTYYMFQIMQKRMTSGSKKEEVVYLNFESPRLLEVQFKDIKEVVHIHQRLFPTTKKKVLFFDEPQNIKFWENAVRELYDDGFSIFISGSSSKLLSKEIATSLRGRSLSYLILPFSFRELLKQRGIEISSRISSDEKTKILSFLDEYLEFGGFPEVVLEKNKELKMKIIENYFDVVVYKDIVERHGIKDAALVRWLIRSVVSSYGNELSIHKLYLTLKSQGRKITKDELYVYASILGDSFFVFYLPKFSWSVRKKEPVNKVYLCDVGFSRLIEVTKDIGKKMENTVYLELVRNMKPMTEIFFWKNVQKEEVDFVVKEGTKVTQLVQVCQDVDDPVTMNREIKALLKASRELKCKNLSVITQNYKEERYAEWLELKEKIHFVPLWEWLLRQE